MNLEDLKYTKDHEWVKVDGEEVVMGISDHAQNELGDITFVELPAVGKEVKQSEPLATVESVKAASEVYAPVTGEVTKINDALTDSPEKINASSYNDGWICRIKMYAPSEVDALMSRDEYNKYLEESH